MDCVVTGIAYDECFPLQSNHSYYPGGFLFPTTPAVFQVGEFPYVMYLAFAQLATDLTFVGLKSLDEVSP